MIEVVCTYAQFRGIVDTANAYPMYRVTGSNMLDMVSCRSSRPDAAHFIISDAVSESTFLADYPHAVKVARIRPGIAHYDWVAAGEAVGLLVTGPARLRSIIVEDSPQSDAVMTVRDGTTVAGPIITEFHVDSVKDRYPLQIYPDAEAVTGLFLSRTQTDFAFFINWEI